jgi:tetratricopeptide (TPR) repeat protein
VHVPGWHDSTKALQAAGRLQMVGIVQEQHPDRARLFMQWKQMNWPVLVDSLNLLGVAVVPITVAIDEHGIVRAINPRKEAIEKDFLARTFEPPAANAAAAAVSSGAVGRQPGRKAPADAWRRYGEDLFLWGGRNAVGKAIEAFERAAAGESNQIDGATTFRLGVAYRARYDSPQRRPGDFRQAVEHWERALKVNPNQYIWRRRIQQYGPRLDKPYSFYDWIPEARTAIAARGESPVVLAVEPAGAEFARPVKTFEADATTRVEPDPKGRIHRDRGELIQIEALTVPGTITAGAASRAHLVMRPNLTKKAHWNNEAEDLVVWVTPPDGWQVDARHITVPRPKAVVSQETRRVEFELRSPANAMPGRVTIPAYALYYVCEDVDGTCLYRRQDVRLDVDVRR